MKITIQGFGVLGPMLGTQTIELPATANTGDALQALANAVPEFAVHQARTAVAIGDELIQANTLLQDGQALVLIPPVGGG